MSSLLQKTGAVLTVILFVSLSLFAQAPEKMTYQAVIRNAGGTLVVSTTIGLKVSILQGSTSGTAVYTETHAPTTNANGLVSVAVGTGSGTTGSFFGINWGSGPYFIKTEIDPDGGTGYTIMGTTELLSVPYALYAKTSGGMPGTYAYIYNDAMQVVPIESDVTFNNNGIATGDIVHAPGTSFIILISSGVYEVTFNISGIEPNQFALFQNGVLVQGSSYGSGAGTQLNTGTVMLVASAGDVLTLRNHTSAAAVTLQSFAGGIQSNVNASIKIQKLGN